MATTDVVASCCVGRAQEKQVKAMENIMKKTIKELIEGENDSLVHHTLYKDIHFQHYKHLLKYSLFF